VVVAGGDVLKIKTPLCKPDENGQQHNMERNAGRTEGIKILQEPEFETREHEEFTLEAHSEGAEFTYRRPVCAASCALCWRCYTLPTYRCRPGFEEVVLC
jgi:hypothetical protein